MKTTVTVLSRRNHNSVITTIVLATIATCLPALATFAQGTPTLRLKLLKVESFNEVNSNNTYAITNDSDELIKLCDITVSLLNGAQEIVGQQYLNFRFLYPHKTIQMQDTSTTSATEIKAFRGNISLVIILNGDSEQNATNSFKLVY